MWHATLITVSSGVNTVQKPLQYVVISNLMKWSMAKERPYQCEDCLKCYNQKGGLRTHVAQHLDEKNKYHCEICRKTFKHRAEYKVHHRLHTGEGKTFQCEFCDMYFKEESALQAHVATHTTKKRWQCDFCTRRFTLKQNLEDHIRVHTKEKPFKCQECEKCFSRRSDLREHIKAHTTGNDTPFPCKYCEESFARSVHLFNHVRKKHQYELARIPSKKKPYQCEYCQLCFVRPGSVLTHKKKKHRGGEFNLWRTGFKWAHAQMHKCMQECCSIFTYTWQNWFLRWFLKPAVFKYRTTVNNSEIYILLPKPCPWMWHLMCGNHVRNGSDRKPETGKTRSLKLALFKNPIGAALWYYHRGHVRIHWISTKDSDSTGGFCYT